MKGYILSIVSAGMICASVRCLLPEKKATGQITRLLGGILMTVTIIAPLTNISFHRITDYFDDFSIAAARYTEDGESAAREQIAGIIKSKSEAYILDKADRMGLEIAVEVELDDRNDSIPSGVKITGTLSPYAKEVMSNYIETTLGIPKERQTWT